MTGGGTALMTEITPVLTAEDYLRCAVVATDRRGWAELMFRAFEARVAALLASGLLRPEEARRGAWRWLGEQLDRMPAPPPWVGDVGVGQP